MAGVQNIVSPKNAAMAIFNPLKKTKQDWKDLTQPNSPQVAQDASGIPYVDQSIIDRQTSDLARKRRGYAANEIAGNVGAGTVTTNVLGGG